MTKKLTALTPGDKREKAALRQEIIATEVLTEREWLLAQLDGR